MRCVRSWWCKSHLIPYLGKHSKAILKEFQFIMNRFLIHPQSRLISWNAPSSHSMVIWFPLLIWGWILGLGEIYRLFTYCSPMGHIFNATCLPLKLLGLSMEIGNSGATIEDIFWKRKINFLQSTVCRTRRKESTKPQTNWKSDSSSVVYIR